MGAAIFFRVLRKSPIFLARKWSCSDNPPPPSGRYRNRSGISICESSLTYTFGVFQITRYPRRLDAVYTALANFLMRRRCAYLVVSTHAPARTYLPLNLHNSCSSSSYKTPLNALTRRCQPCRGAFTAGVRSLCIARSWVEVK